MFVAPNACRYRRTFVDVLLPTLACSNIVETLSFSPLNTAHGSLVNAVGNVNTTSPSDTLLV